MVKVHFLCRHIQRLFKCLNPTQRIVGPLSEPLGEKLILCSIRPRSRYSHGLVVRATNYVRARPSP